MIEQDLEKLGFSPSEIKVYLHLLKNGANYANRISSETKINRTNIYEALDRLISKGVVSLITKNKVRWFEANSLKAILTLINQKKEEIISIKKDVLSKLNKLKSEFKENIHLEAAIFTGKKGLRIIFEEILNAGKPISLIASQLQFEQFFPEYFELWHKQRIKKRIKQKSIFPKKFKERLKKRTLLDYKFIEDSYTNPTTTIIYGDNCLFIQWTKEPLVIKIKSKEIVKSHINYFNLLWRLAKK